MVSSFSTTRTTRRRNLAVNSFLHTDDSADFATPLELTASDKERLVAFKSRQKTMPILILDSLLPKQELSFESSDPNFLRLIQYCWENGSDVAMLGTNPLTGIPLSRGVTCPIDGEQLRISPTMKSMGLSLTADRRVEVQSEPWLDPTGSFYLSKVELIDGHKEPPLGTEHQKMATRLFESLPTAIEEWSQFVVNSGTTDKKGLSSRLKSLGPMPSDMTDRAFWVAAAINPLPTLGVCLEIRPAMLCCTNDYERMVLACQAVQSSIDHVSGKRRLF